MTTLHLLASSNGEVTLTANPDYEIKSSYSFTVVATDTSGNASEQVVTLGINDVDDPTVITVVIRGNSLNNILTGTINTQNVINGDGGNDSLTGANLKDTLLGGSGNDTLIGNEENDFLDGGSSNDSLLGGTGNDILTGGSGNDTLIGGNGADNISGGSGLDLFLYQSPNQGEDRITDFSLTEDKIGISASGFGGGLIANTPLTSAQFSLGTSATLETQRFIYDSSTGALFFDADGSNSGSGQIQIAQLHGRPAINLQHFQIVT